MRTTKRIIALVLVAVMMAASWVAVNAANNDGKITVTNPVKNETYTLYKIFDVSYYTEKTSGDKTTLDKVGYTYTASGDDDSFLTALNGESSPFEVEKNGTVYSIALKSGKTETDIESFIKANLSLLTASATATADNEGNSVVFTNLPYGYYFLTTTVGTLATISTDVKEIEVKEKNSLPTVEKTVGEAGEDGKMVWSETGDFSIGEKIPYKLDFTVSKGNTKFKIIDTLTNQNYINGSLVVYKDSKTNKAIENTDYTVNYNADTKVITIELTDEFVSSIYSDYDGKFSIEYFAEFDKDNLKNIIIDKNTNKVEIKYSNNVITDSTEVKSFKFDIVKTDDDEDTPKLLTGAKFSLWDAENDGNEIGLIYDSTLNAFRPVIGDEEATGIVMSEKAVATIYGLASGTYYLQEDVAPIGFNKLTSRCKVELTDNNTATVENNVYVEGGIQVVNGTGTILPETGGIGTKIFVGIGLFIVLAAGIFIITNKRMSKEAF